MIGLTSIYGNVTTDQATINCLNLLEIAGRTDIPVANGVACSLNSENNGDWSGFIDDADSIVHGKDGLGNTNLPLPKAVPVSQSAPEFIVEKVLEFPGEITLVPIGPLTNLAQAIHLNPDFVSKVKRIVMMGGAAFAPGNVNPAAEANIFSDPEAADIVFQADWSLTMLGLDVTENILLTNEHLSQLTASSKSTAKFINQSVPVYLNFYNKKNGGLGCSMHDPAAIAYILDPNLFEVQDFPVSIGIQGSGRGKTWAWMPWHLWDKHVNAEKKVRVVLGANADKVLQNMINTIF